MSGTKGVFLTTPQLIDAHLASGMNYSQAVAAVAAASGIRGEDLDRAWRTARAQAARAARPGRNAEILLLHRDGVDAAAIANRFALHPKTIGRIIDGARP